MAESSPLKDEEKLFFPRKISNDARPRLSSGDQPANNITHRRSRLSRAAEVKEDENNNQDACNCPLESQHLGKELINVEISLPVDAVFTLLFVQEQFMVDVYLAKKTTEVTATSWQDGEDGMKTRQMTYTMGLPPSSISPKVSYVTENQHLMPQSKPGDIYVVECEVTNAGIPYSDAFNVIKHYCIIKQAVGRTSLTCWVHVKFKKSIFGFVKSMIEKNTYQGVEALLQEVHAQLASEAGRIGNPRLGRKRRRGTNATPRSRSRSPGPTSVKKGSQNLESSGGLSKKLLIMTMVIALASLFIGNVILYRKLFRLEELANINPKVNLPSTRYFGVETSWETVARILQKQQQLHTSQLEVWKTKVGNALQSVNEIQETLEWIVEKIKQQEETADTFIKEKSNEVKQQWLSENALKEEQLRTIIQ